MIKDILESKITAGLALFWLLLGLQWLIPKIKTLN
jgi:hypothetical protein